MNCIFYFHQKREGNSFLGNATFKLNSHLCLSYNTHFVEKIVNDFFLMFIEKKMNACDRMYNEQWKKIENGFLINYEKRRKMKSTFFLCVATIKPLFPFFTVFLRQPQPKG